jgi:hypothetical protein
MIPTDPKGVDFMIFLFMCQTVAQRRLSPIVSVRGFSAAFQ